MDITGKKALVFGGTAGIGLAAVRQLVELGADVVAISRDPNQTRSISEQVPDGITLEACDVLDRDAVAALCEKHAPYDILISAATGGSRAFGPFLEMDLDGYQGSFAILWGYVNVVRLGAHHLSEEGSIVLVSGSPARKASAGLAALSSVGGAVEALVRAVAPEIYPRRLNVVSPGTIDTPMVLAQGDERTELLASMTAGNIIPRAGTPDEVAQGIIFMVQNDFVTGTTIDVDGGALLS